MWRVQERRRRGLTSEFRQQLGQGSDPAGICRIVGQEVAIDGQRLAVGLVGVGEAAGVRVEDSEIVERTSGR